MRFKLAESLPVTATACKLGDMPMALLNDQDAVSASEEVHHYDGAVGGWGSLKGLGAVVLREKPGAVELGEELLRQNKPGGFMCVSCAWSKPAEPNPAEFCENGAKATAWDLTRHRCTPEFFAEHTLTETGLARLRLGAPGAPYLANAI